MTTLAVTSINSLRCHASTCFRLGSKFLCIRSTPTEMQSMSENDFECFASTGVNAPETMSPNRRGPAPYGFQLSIRRISDQHMHCPLKRRTRPRHLCRVNFDVNNLKSFKLPCFSVFTTHKNSPGMAY